MSQSTAVHAARPAARTASRPAARASGRPAAARLRVVAPPAGARSRAGLVVGCLILLAVGLVGLLLLNVSIEKGAFVLGRQQAELQKLVEQSEALKEDIASLQAPQSLTRQADALGMVPAPNAAFVRPSDGRVLGSPGVASPPPTVTKGPANGRATTAGPAATPSPAKGTTAGTAKAPTKVTAPGVGAATTTAGSGTPAGQRTRATTSAGGSAQKTSVPKATTKAGTSSGAPARKVATKPPATAGGTA